jgi:hypothetical protein
LEDQRFKAEGSELLKYKRRGKLFTTKQNRQAGKLTKVSIMDTENRKEEKGNCFSVRARVIQGDVPVWG